MENIKKALNATTAVVFVVAFLLGYGVSSQVMNRDKENSPTPQETAMAEDAKLPVELADLSGAVVAPEAPTPVMTGEQVTEAAVSANDQPAGIIATVTVTLDNAMWVAIHEDAKGAPGRILGAQMFAKGAHTGAVDLLRPMEADRKYYAIVHSDDGDHAFDQKKDMPAKNTDGSAVMHAFMTIAAAGTVQEN